jgi:hypothetical protein
MTPTTLDEEVRGPVDNTVECDPDCLYCSGPETD